MCFSASASFVASGGLAIIGGASLASAPKNQRILTLVPILFAVQQALEGIQWLAIGQGTVCRAAGYGFLFFALILWPIYIPLVVYILDKSKRSVAKRFMFVGSAVAAWFIFLIAELPLKISTVGGHIFYDPPGAFDWNVAQILYVAIIFGAMIVSSLKPIRTLGAATLAAAILTLLVSMYAAASLWCFFAACVSAYVFFIIRSKSLGRV